MGQKYTMLALDPQITIMMTREEAQEHVIAIRSAAADMGRRLLDLKERQGWRALGYETWTDCLEGEFSYSRKHLYELMKAAPVLEWMLPTGNKISTKAAAALANYPAEILPAIIQTAQARYGELTESNVSRVGRVIQEMTTTGHVDVGNGTATPIDAALDVEDYESWRRQQTYIHDHAERRDSPHVTHNSGQNEWYTPGYLIEAARRVMGSIDFDPASSEIANQTVRANAYYTIYTDGLSQDWRGNVWLNPPYSQPDIGYFVDKLIAEQGQIDQICILVNNATETTWFQSLLGIAQRVCLLRGRVKFLDAQLQPNGAPLQGQAVLYAGPNLRRFGDVFTEFGAILDVRQR